MRDEAASILLRAAPEDLFGATLSPGATLGLLAVLACKQAWIPVSQVPGGDTVITELLERGVIDLWLDYPGEPQATLSALAAAKLGVSVDRVVWAAYRPGIEIDASIYKDPTESILAQDEFSYWEGSDLLRQERMPHTHGFVPLPFAAAAAIAEPEPVAPSRQVSAFVNVKLLNTVVRNLAPKPPRSRKKSRKRGKDCAVPETARKGCALSIGKETPL